MIYGEKLNDETDEMEKGIFLFWNEVIEYRKNGWTFNEEINKQADEEIQKESSNA